ncbi:hypothetical protein F4X90_09025, partial [Candidatus Poribacteria bacterium]|nr:hypothetical protein [Candidatus Poribacteria bacterium]
MMRDAAGIGYTPEQRDAFGQLAVNLQASGAPQEAVQAALDGNPIPYQQWEEQFYEDHFLVDQEKADRLGIEQGYYPNNLQPLIDLWDAEATVNAFYSPDQFAGGETAAPFLRPRMSAMTKQRYRDNPELLEELRQDHPESHASLMQSWAEEALD